MFFQYKWEICVQELGSIFFLIPMKISDFRVSGGEVDFGVRGKLNRTAETSQQLNTRQT